MYALKDPIGDSKGTREDEQREILLSSAASQKLIFNNHYSISNIPQKLHPPGIEPRTFALQAGDAYH